MDPSSSSARMPTVFRTTPFLQRNSHFINQLAGVPGAARGIMREKNLDF